MFEDVPSSFCGTSSSSSESMGLCFFASVANHAASSLRLWFSFYLVFVEFLFFVATLNGHSRDFVVPQLLTHHVVCVGTCTGARSRDLDPCRLPELPESSSGTVSSSWITIGGIGGTGGVCGTGIGGVCGAGIGGVCDACA